MTTRPCRRLRPELSTLEGRLTLSHVSIAAHASRDGATVATGEVVAPKATTFEGTMTLAIGSHYYENAYLDGVFVNIHGGGDTKPLGRYAVDDYIDTDLDNYNKFFYGDPRGSAEYHGELHFKNRMTLDVDWKLTSHHTEPTYAHQTVHLNGEIFSPKSGHTIGEITGDGVLVRQHADTHGQDWAFKGKIRGSFKLGPS